MVLLADRSQSVCERSAGRPAPVSVPVDPESYGSGEASGGVFAFMDTLKRSNYMLGNLWGLRTALSKFGTSLAIQETSEGLGNATGGSREGFEYDGLTQMVLQTDTNRAFGHYGGLFNISALEIHGRSVSADNLQTLQTASGIEADRALRMWEFWYQQKFLSEDRLDVKIGQQSLDQEFIVSQNALLFVNTMFGWPMVPSADLPGGGPAYPLSDLGVRIRARPINSVQILAGIFNGSPTRNQLADSQAENKSGTSFPLNGRTLAIAELQYAYPSLGGVSYPDQRPALPHTYRLGAWYDAEKFADQRLDSNGVSLANPASNGMPRNHHGNYSIYAVADQMLWMYDRDANRSVSAFGRVMGTPEEARNLIDLSVNAGLVMHQPLFYRNDDTFGVGVGYTHVSNSVSALDQDTANYTGAFTPIQRSETFVETTYQYQARPWWQIQPDIQYVFKPGAGVANPNLPNERIANELVLGVRTNIAF